MAADWQIFFVGFNIVVIKGCGGKFFGNVT